jgi:hypothetical protein
MYQRYELWGFHGCNVSSRVGYQRLGGIHAANTTRRHNPENFDLKYINVDQFSIVLRKRIPVDLKSKYRTSPGILLKHSVKKSLNSLFTTTVINIYIPVDQCSIICCSGAA